MKENLKKVLKAVSVFIVGIATGIVIAEYGENAMYDFCGQCSSEPESETELEDAETISNAV